MTDLLTAFKAKRDEIGTKALAARLGISEGAVRMVATGHYPDPSNILSTFAAQFVNPDCPFTGDKITRQDCDNHASGPRPFGGQTKQHWWDACQTCAYKGKRQ